MIYALDSIEEAVAAVRKQKSDAGRYVVISRILAGNINYSDHNGKVLGTRRALFCSALSRERLWPEKKT